jgi:hypothetical protein
MDRRDGVYRNLSLLQLEIAGPSELVEERARAIEGVSV